MSVRITWPPTGDEDLDYYELERAEAVAGPWTLVIAVPADQEDSEYWDGENYVYDDAAGTDAHYYRLTSVNQAGNRSAPSPAFKPADVVTTGPNRTKVDHNYGSANALRYQTTNGTPVEGAVIRIYAKEEFDMGNTDAPIGVTTTTAAGTWENPIHLEAGRTYVVQFFKEGLYGPNKTEITV